MPSAKNMCINCGNCSTDCSHRLGYTVPIWVTTPCSLAHDYQLRREMSTWMIEAAYLLFCLLSINYEDPSTCLWLNITVGQLEFQPDVFPYPIHWKMLVQCTLSNVMDYHTYYFSVSLP
jgi:hypothetical protein